MQMIVDTNSGSEVILLLLIKTHYLKEEMFNIQDVVDFCYLSKSSMFASNFHKEKACDA